MSRGFLVNKNGSPMYVLPFSIELYVFTSTELYSCRSYRHQLLSQSINLKADH